MRHTQGPWQVLYSSNTFPSIHSKNTNSPIAVLYEYVAEDSRDILDNAQANAQLIAAAPEMLETIERLLSVIETHLSHSEKMHTFNRYAVVDAEKLINKVKGA